MRGGDPIVQDGVGGGMGYVVGGESYVGSPPLTKIRVSLSFVGIVPVSATVAEVHPSLFTSAIGDGGMIACAGAVCIAESSCMKTGAVAETIPHGSSDGASSYRRADAKGIYLR